MAAQRYSQPSDGSVFCAILLLLLAVGFVIKYIWWFVGGAVLVGVSVAVYRLAQKRGEQRRLEADEAADREFERIRRAERHKRWTLIGDQRAVYGEDGAAAMRKITDGPEMDEEPGPDASAVAQVATTPQELDALVRDKPKAWEQALYVSVLVQRVAPLQSRLRDSELGFTAPTSTGALSPAHLASTVVTLIDEMIATAEHLQGFMTAPAFMAAFTGKDDTGADPEAIKHIAHRTMDYLERFLELSERCRALPVRSGHVDIVADCARMLDDPLASYREFIADFVDVIEALPKVLKHATGPVDMGSLGLYLKIDDKRHSRILKRLDAITTT
ncbi:hypothetical protein [Mycolicibacterium vaccae]|uniref:Uncharacterized protein n=1 Tax=Mycolicibacterium vaccae ATCC 25954 TaxID=1194972 RepID=K0UYH3_MYCVA|nr:hypothetical protein [Mycolicibacterium vaccae]ANI38128.1 hypothetical protein MYVA_0889 [Mycolicibacterium vaccae 95051]EJZ12187.1 hypothetical protein MVAC_02986 [Mycolicibacterium vaccae ATCC 25954]